MDSENKENKEMYKGLYHGYNPDPEDQRLAPFDRLKNLLKEDDVIEVDEQIEGKIDYLLGNKEKPTPNEKKWRWSWSHIIDSIKRFKLWLHLKLFPNPNYNKFYKRK